MNPIKTIYLGIEVLENTNNTLTDPELTAEHYVYAYPTIEFNPSDNTANLKVVFESEYMKGNSYSYRFATESKYTFENFELDEGKTGLIEDYVFLAHHKHIDMLREKLPNQIYVDRIKTTLSEDAYKSSIETIIYFEMRSHKLLA